MALDDLVSAQVGVRPRGAAGTNTAGDAPSGVEWTAPTLRPVAHWVLMPADGGRNRLTMVWEIPDPLPPR